METQTKVSESYENFADKYERGNHVVGVSMWEFEWVTKYRYKMFRKWKYKKLVEACIRRAASMHGIKWIELNVQPEHVQGTASIPMTMSPSMALQYTSFPRLCWVFGKDVLEICELNYKQIIGNLYI